MPGDERRASPSVAICTSTSLSIYTACEKCAPGKMSSCEGRDKAYSFWYRRGAPLVGLGTARDFRNSSQSARQTLFLFCKSDGNVAARLASEPNHLVHVAWPQESLSWK